MTAARRKVSPAMQRMEIVADLTVQARDAILAEKKLKTTASANRKKALAARIESGQHLNDLRRMIEADRSLADGKTFWQWFDYTFAKDKICSRRDAEKRMKIAGSADPKGALAEERRKAREGMAKNYAAKKEVLSRNETQQDQQDEGGATQPTKPKKARSSDGNVVSLNVTSALKIIRAMTDAEREQLYSQLRKDNLL